MKTKLVLLGAAVLLALINLVAQTRSTSPTKELMRQKLDHAQSVLEGITLENFDLIAGHAAKLGALSQEAGWRASDTPEYAEHSAIFRRNIETLRKAARERNLDGAALAYTKLTFSCVECHKYLRNRKVAEVSGSKTLSGMLIDTSGSALAPDFQNKKKGLFGKIGRDGQRDAHQFVSDARGKGIEMEKLITE